MTDKKPSKIMSKKPSEIAKENKKIGMSPDPRIDKQHKEKAKKLNEKNEEFGGQEGEDPTRYGDWEKGGRCTDF